MERVTKELESLQGKEWLLEVLQPIRRREHHNDDGTVWEFEIKIAAPERCVYALQPVHVRITGNDGYPSETFPTVMVLGIVDHYLIDNHIVNDSFYHALDDDLTLLGILQTFQTMLAGPLHPCDDCQHHYDASANTHRDRLRSIEVYRPMRLHKDIYSGTWNPDWFHPDMRHLVAAAVAGEGTGHIKLEAVRPLLVEEAPGIFSFPMFTTEFCDYFLEEIFNFYRRADENELHIHRPNSMNRYGVIVNQIGMEEAIDKLQALLLEPISQLLYPLEGARLDAHHTFMVEYKAEAGKDTHLDMHVDDSDITFNVCLGKEGFTGAGLSFCGYVGKPDHRVHSLQYKHRRGYCVVHLGTRRHGADVITSGERYNLIIWNHNTAYRTSPHYQSHTRRYEAEATAPDEICLSYTHDRDYGVYKKYTDANRAHSGKGWCPPKHREYPGFVEEGAVKNAGEKN